MSDFAAVFFLPSLLCPRGVPLWLTRSCRKKNVRLCGTSWTPSPTITGSYGGIPRAHTVRPYIHVNRSPNNLRKPTSDLKLIVLTEVSELASESWLRRRSLSGRALGKRPYNSDPSAKRTQ